MKEHDQSGPKGVVFLFACALMLLSGCITLPREDGPPAAPTKAEVAGFPSDIRIVGIDPDAAQGVENRLEMLRRASDGSLDFLALSGGGAGGSYGAGVLYGMTVAGHRPQFEVVTGVSTGALIAPFAFLGSDWDDELRAAFATEAASGVMESRGIGILFNPSFFKGEPLRALVDEFVTKDLISAVAKEAEKGRILMVATTDLDTQQPVYWNLGEIAKRRDDEARDLFKDVLVASASVPGVFPPVMMPVEFEGQVFEEMHVDGGATVPFFLGPELWSLWTTADTPLRNANIYIVVNGQVQSPSRSTPVNTVQIIARSFETMLIYASRIAIGEYAALSTKHNMTMHVAFIPTDLAFAGPLDFKADEREKLFDYARTCARQDLIFFSEDTLTDAMRNSDVSYEELKEGYGIPSRCPTQPRDMFEKKPAAEDEVSDSTS
ncbi:patatin-like phospholipase family protein [Ponticaulis profundi]|uniref:Patatin-like phospholipase family protein n=1 Tax=Ponticaulis profundi TaxID=2665222 RepID=A0ABW1S6C2_9PROT